MKLFVILWVFLIKSFAGNVVQLLHVGDQILTMTEVGHSVNIEAVQALLTVDSCFRSLMVSGKIYFLSYFNASLNKISDIYFHARARNSQK